MSFIAFVSSYQVEFYALYAIFVMLRKISVYNRRWSSSSSLLFLLFAFIVVNNMKCHKMETSFFPRYIRFMLSGGWKFNIFSRNLIYCLDMLKNYCCCSVWVRKKKLQKSVVTNKQTTSEMEIFNSYIPIFYSTTQ